MNVDKSKFHTMLVRPVIIVTTISDDGKANAAPFSFNSPISFSPPIMGFSSYPQHDTWTNIQKNGEFVVNVAGKKLGEYMHILEQKFPYGVNELEEAGLSSSPSKEVKPPRIDDALGWMECKTVSSEELGDHVWIAGEVLEAEVRDDYYDGVVDAGEALSHVSGKQFAQDAKLKEYKRAKK